MRLGLLALALLGHHTGSLGHGHDDGLFQNIGGGVADVGAGGNDLAGLEAHLAGGVADVGDFPVCLDVVAGIHGGLEFDVVVGAEQALVAVQLDQQLGGHVTEQVDHVGAVHQIASIVGILRGHTDADQRGVLFFFHLESLLHKNFVGTTT